MKTLSLVAVTSSLLLGLPAAHATIVFSDDFESPDVTAAQSDGNTSGAVPSGWVGATSGFGSTRRGVVDEAHGDFTDPVGEQAFAFRYTNSGLTSDVGEIGSLSLGQTITVSFDVVMDGHNDGLPYEAGLVLFNGGARNAVETYDKNTVGVLAKSSGSASNDGLYTTIMFSYIVGDAVVDNNGAAGGGGITWDPGLLGNDIAIRFKGATGSATIDNVSIDISVIPEPRVALLGGLGLLGLLRRRR